MIRKLKNLAAGLLMLAGLTLGPSAHAGMPVIDGANLMQAIQQVFAWGKQYNQMVQQIQQAKQAYSNVNGVRNLGKLAHDQQLRQYLPTDAKTLTAQGVGQWQQIYDTNRRFQVAGSSLSTSSEAAKGMDAVAKQAAINRAASEESYRTATQRFANIEALMNKINASPDAKDIADLQARLQAEQSLLQNEANRLNTLKQLADAQRELQTQRTVETRMSSQRGAMPNGW